MTRLPTGGRIDRSRPFRFTFNGHAYQGFAGDTLASALLANDVRVVANSVTYGRPRGVFSAGVEEPNALVQIGPEPMLRATQVELVDGFAREQRYQPMGTGLDLDLGRDPILYDPRDDAGKAIASGSRHDDIRRLAFRRLREAR